MTIYIEISILEHEAQSTDTEAAQEEDAVELNLLSPRQERHTRIRSLAPPPDTQQEAERPNKKRCSTRSKRKTRQDKSIENPDEDNEADSIGSVEKNFVESVLGPDPPRTHKPKNVQQTNVRPNKERRLTRSQKKTKKI